MCGNGNAPLTGNTLTINYTTIMKKLFKNLFLAVGAFALAATGMTSCNEEGSETYDTNYDVQGAYYNMKSLGYESNDFMLSIVDKDLGFNEEGVPVSGSGYMVNIDIVSSAEGEPNEGNYAIAAEGEEFAANGIISEQGGYAGTYVAKITDGSYSESDVSLIEEGSVTLKKEDGNWIITTDFKLNDGSDFKLNVKTPIDWIDVVAELEGDGDGDGDGDYDPEWALEPKTPTTLQITFTQASAEITQDNAIEFTLSSASEGASIVIFPADPSNPYGIYEMNGTMADGTALASEGGTQADNGINVYPSYVTTGVTSSGVTNIYYLATGTVTYNQNVLQIDTKSHHGSTVQCVYRGTITPTQGAAAVAEKVAMRKAQPILKAKPFMAR